MIRVFVGLLAFASCGSVQAAPMIYLTLEGRTHGSDAPYSSNVHVQLGDTIEYRLRLFLGPPTIPIDQVPRNLSGTLRHGASSLSLDIVQDPAAAIQVDFGQPGVLGAETYDGAGDGWDIGVGARGGTPVIRSSLLGQDLLDIRPMHRAGVYTAWDWETVISGTFTVASISGESADVQSRWGSISGAYLFNGGTYFLLPNNPTRANGTAHYSPLTLTAGSFASVPEPSSIALAGAALVALALIRRRAKCAAIGRIAAD